MSTTTIALKSGTKISTSTDYDSGAFLGFSVEVTSAELRYSSVLSNHLSNDEIRDINATIAYLVAAKIAEKEMNHDKR